MGLTLSGNWIAKKIKSSDATVPRSSASAVTKLYLDHQRKRYRRNQNWKMNPTINQHVKLMLIESGAYDMEAKINGALI